MRCNRPGDINRVLPDDVLLEIFEFFVFNYGPSRYCMGTPNFRHGYARFNDLIVRWQSLVHVCQRWRGIVFGSPRRLHLQLLFSTTKTPARDTLDGWPVLPLQIHVKDRVSRTEDVDNIIAVLERSDRVNEVFLFDVDGSPLERVLAAMQEPFLELRHLLLDSSNGEAPVLPDSFLGKSAPRLQHLCLASLPFPGLPNLLFSTAQLALLQLVEIPHSGYISPEAMVTALSTLTQLESLTLQFKSPLSHPDWDSRRPLPKTRAVLPALTYFWFGGVSEYLDDLVARIDAPLLDTFFIYFFNQITFYTSKLIQFIHRTPILIALKKARVAFGDRAATVRFSTEFLFPHEVLEVNISCRELDWQVSSLEQVLTSCMPPLSALEDLYIFQAFYSDPHWQDNLENTSWLELLHPFSAAKNLYLSEEFAPRVGSALQELVGERTTEVLPNLQNIFLEGLRSWVPVQEDIRRFVATRQDTGHLIGVSYWDSMKDKDLRPYQ